MSSSASGLMMSIVMTAEIDKSAVAFFCEKNRASQTVATGSTRVNAIDGED